MKQFILILVILNMPIISFTQNHKSDFGSCFNKSNRKSISNKMDNFLTRVSKETGCPKEKLIYSIDEFYTVFYSKPCKHLPKRITFEVCGKKITYIHQGLSGNITYWLLGSWVLSNQ